MFPFKIRFTSAPLSFVTSKLDCPMVGCGVGMRDDVGVDVSVWVGVGVKVGVGVGAAVLGGGV